MTSAYGDCDGTSLAPTMRLTLRYDDGALDHCVRVTLPDPYAKPCSVLVKPFLKSSNHFSNPVHVK